MMLQNQTNNPGADSARAGALSIPDLRLAAELALLAYDGSPWPSDYTLHTFKVITVKHLDLRAIICWYVGATPGKIARIDILLRGTVDMRNWLLNLDVMKKEMGRIKLHAGFLAGADALLPLIIAAILPTGADKSALPPICIIGHSLGGALATLLAYFLDDQGFPVQDVITFASPRVGDAAWRDSYNATLGDRTLRVVAAGDMVPLIPGVLDGYRHVGQEIYLDGKVWLNPSRLMEIACDSWRALRAMDQFDFDFILQFHSMANDYLKLLTVGP
jgi:hypothetical protein